MKTFLFITSLLALFNAQQFNITTTTPAVSTTSTLTPATPAVPSSPTDTSLPAMPTSTSAMPTDSTQQQQQPTSTNTATQQTQTPSPTDPDNIVSKIENIPSEVAKPFKGSASGLSLNGVLVAMTGLVAAMFW